MFRDLLEESIPAVRTIEFGGVVSTKRKLLSDLRTAFDEGRIRLPASGYWAEVQRQCLNYKLADRKLEQDLVMCLAIIVKIARALPVPGTKFDGKFVYGAPEPERDLDYLGRLFAGEELGDGPGQTTVAGLMPPS